MTIQRHTIVVVSEHNDIRFDLTRAAELSGMHPEMILEFVRAELVHADHPKTQAEPRFGESEIVRLRQIEHLRNRENLSLRMLCRVVRMLDRLEAAEQELHQLRERLR